MRYIAMVCDVTPIPAIYSTFLAGKRSRSTVLREKCGARIFLARTFSLVTGWCWRLCLSHVPGTGSIRLFLAISSVRSLRYFRYKQDDFRHDRNSITLRTTTFFFEVNVRGKLLIDGFGYIYNVCTTSMSCPRSNNSIHITMRLGLAGHFGYPWRRCRPYPLVCLPQRVMCTRPTATLFFGGVFPIWR